MVRRSAFEAARPILQTCPLILTLELEQPTLCTVPKRVKRAGDPSLMVASAQCISVQLVLSLSQAAAAGCLIWMSIVLWSLSFFNSSLCFVIGHRKLSIGKGVT